MTTYFRGKYRNETARLPNWDYSAPGWYFITICTKNRIHYFGKIKNGTMILSKIGKIVVDEWLKTPNIRPDVQLDEWIIMPDHLHGIIILKNEPTVVGTSRRDVPTTNPSKLKLSSTRRDVPTTNPPKLKPSSIGSIINQFKSICTKRIWEMGYRQFKWQPRFYDHIIRNEKSLNRIRTYIIHNPSKWELTHNHR